MSDAPRGGIGEMLAIALPMVMSHACDTAMTFTDRLFLAKLGPVHMSAAMSGGLSSWMMMTFWVGLISYSTALVAQYLGSGNRRRCAVVTTQALIIAAAAYPVILLARPAAHALFAVMDIPPGQLALQAVYFDILLYGSIIGLVRSALSGFFSGVGRTRVVMLATLVSMVVNIVMNWVLIYGKLGAPALGIRGAAYGTILGGAVGLVVLIAAYLRPAIRHAYGVSEGWRLDRFALGALVRFGYPAGLEMALNMLAFAALIMTFQAVDPATGAAITIVFNWDMVCFVPMIGVNVGVVSLVGRYMGARQPDVAHRATMSGLRLAVAWSAMILLAFALFAGPLVGIFQPAESQGVFETARPLAVFMLRLASLYVMADAVMLVFSGALRGAGDTFWAMCISVGFHWLFLPVTWVMLRVFHIGPRPTWVVLVVLIVVCSAAFYLRYRTGRWRDIRVVHGGLETVPPDAGVPELPEA
ncbi:MAG: MATE family efflux transporter [Planctomycetes bacterium]|nr:MATE family efflux transporter [Planctomycetota bacterium]